MIALHFAPLQGYTDDVYRRLHHQLVGGVDFYYTPFVRLEHGSPRSKDLRDILPAHNEHVPVVPQIIAADVQEFRTLTDLIRENGYRRLDLNMGCPFPLQAKHGRGCGLLAQTDEIAAMFAEMKQHPEVQFSIKLRLGWDNPTVAQQLLPFINEAPLMQVALHPRIGTQGYKGTTDVEAFAAFASECKKPLVYNGDLTSPEEVLQMQERFPQLVGIMVGRGLLARPSLGAELREQREWTRHERIALLHQLHDALHAHYARIIPGEVQLHQKLRTFWDYLEPEIGRKAFKAVHKAGNLRNYLRAVAEVV